MVGVWRWRGCGGGGCGAGLAAFLAACAFFDVVVDVPVVQVVDVGLSSSWTRLSCPLLCKTEVLVQTVQPGDSAVAVLGQGGDMPVVATTGAFGRLLTCPLLRMSCSSC